MDSNLRHSGKIPHILFWFSDTGGGHRSAAEAIIEALEYNFEGCVSTEMVDFLADYAPPPFCHLPGFYPRMVQSPRIWEAMYRLSDGRFQASVIETVIWPYVRKAAHRLLAEHPSDLIVSVHPLAQFPVRRALNGIHPVPFTTVVTDLASTHALWYTPHPDLCLVPTSTARQHAIESGMKPDRIRVAGLPVAHGFDARPQVDTADLKSHLGWPVDRPVVLLTGGGEGMGPLEEIARAINQARLPVTLVVIAGRNQALQEKLCGEDWPIPTFVYGFIKQMPEFMQASDVLITKAGPGTISEALNMNLPMILYSRLPGQEDGNVSLVISHGAGVWAPTPERVVAAVRYWLDSPASHTRAAEACARLACPDAARRVAHILLSQLGLVGEEGNGSTMFPL